MTEAERWAQVEQLFSDAIDQAPAERERFVRTATTDPTLRDLVLRMLEAHAEEGGPLDQPLDLHPVLSVRERLESVLGERYRLEREIGRGGMATVYLAVEQKHDRQVVIKALNPDAAAAFGSRRFLDEIRVIAQLPHPHILPLIDSGGAADVDAGPLALPADLLYYVMPHVGGGTLRQRLRREGTLSVELSRSILRDIAGALALAHRHGIVHRDLKPENVLLVGDHPYLLDFGIALLRAAVSDTRVTGQGVAVGTIGYMAPEQATGMVVGPAADVYAWGILAREMLSGATPESLMTPLTDPALAPLRQIDAPLFALVCEALDPDPAHRPADGEALAARLAVGPDPAAERVVEGSGVRWWSWAALLVVVVGAGWMLVRARTMSTLSGALQEPVVVAPFRNETGDSSLATWGRLAGDWITQGLQETGRVKVVPWLAARDIGPATEDGGTIVQRLQRETGARTVITGAYYLAGDRIRFQAEVVDAAGGAVLAAPAPAIALRDSAEQAVRLLRTRVMGALAIRSDSTIGMIPGLAERPPTYEAYRAFDRGVQLHVAQQYDSAAAAFRGAFALDSTFGIALLYASIDLWNTGNLAGMDSLLRDLRRRDLALGEYHEQLRSYETAVLAGQGLQALTTIRRASEGSPHARGQYLVGWTALALHRPGEALVALRKIDPDVGGMKGWAPYWTQLSHAWHLTGDHVAELAVAREMQRRYPESTVARVLAVRAAAAQGSAPLVDSLLQAAEGSSPDTYWSYGAALVVAGEEYSAHGRAFLAGDMYKRAVRWFANQLTRSPHHRAHRYWMGSALYEAGRWPEAAPYFESLLHDYPERVLYRGLVALTDARAGRGQLAERHLGPRPPYAPGEHTIFRARLAVIAGRQEEAISLLTQAATEGYESFPWLHATALRDLSPILDDPRLRRVLRSDSLLPTP